MKKISEVFLVCSLSLVYVWFGVLKILGVSPIASLVIHTFPFLPNPSLMVILGVGEMAIGIGLLFPFTRKLAIIALWGHLGGTFFGVILHHSLYFTHNNPLLLTNLGNL